MPRMEETNGHPITFQRSAEGADNANATLNRPAAGANRRYAVSGFYLNIRGTLPTTAVRVILQQNGAEVTDFLVHPTKSGDFIPFGPSAWLSEPNATYDLIASAAGVGSFVRVVAAERVVAA